MPIYRGAKYSKDIQFKTRSGGQPIDITTWQFDALLKDAAGTTLLDMSTSGGQFSVFDGPNGWLRWSLTVTQTQALVAGAVAFALYRTDESDGPSRIARVNDQVREKD